MSSPREAVYDVLLMKARRALDVRTSFAGERVADSSLAADWARYEEKNEEANLAYRTRRTGRM